MTRRGSTQRWPHVPSHYVGRYISHWSYSFACARVWRRFRTVWVSLVGRWRNLYRRGESETRWGSKVTHDDGTQNSVKYKPKYVRAHILNKESIHSMQRYDELTPTKLVSHKTKRPLLYSNAPIQKLPNNATYWVTDTALSTFGSLQTLKTKLRTTSPA